MEKIKVLVIIPRFERHPIPQFARMNDALNCLISKYKNDIDIDVCVTSDYMRKVGGVVKKFCKLLSLLRIMRNANGEYDIVHIVSIYPYYIDILFRMALVKPDIIGPNLIRFPPLRFLQNDKVRMIFRKQYGIIWAGFNKSLLQVMDKVRAKVLFNGSKYVLTMSGHSKDIMEYLGVRNEKNLVMPAAALSLKIDNDSGFQVILDKIQKQKKGRKVVLYAGALSVPKGAALMADLIKTTSENTCLYVVAGKGPLKSLFLELYKHKNNLLLTGCLNRQALIKLYNIVDIYVQPTYEEQLSVTVIESLRAGTPVLCSNHPSFTKIGFDKSIEFFELGDMVDMRMKLLHMVANIEQHKEDAKRNMEAYDVKIAAQFLLELYQNAANRNKLSC